MWTIQGFSIEGTSSAQAYMSDGQPIVGTRRGPEGASFRLYVAGIGLLDVTDTGHQPGGPHYWQIVLNDEVYWYDGDGAPQITVNADGTFSVSGDGNQLDGNLLPLPQVDPADIEIVEAMKAAGILPYSQLLSNHRPYSAVQATAKQWLQYSANWDDLGLCVYDWTTADFFRMVLFHLYRYTGISGEPLDGVDIINGIWTANWPPYQPSNAPFMKSLMMTPATSEQDVATQYASVSAKLSSCLDALMRVTMAAMTALPRTSTISKPMLYSGQVDIANLGMNAMAVYFEEYPGNAGPVGSPMGMPLADALGGFMAAGNTLTLKGFVSFTDSEEDALHYSNGILLEVAPPPGAVVWSQCAYLTELSDEASKIEYTYLPGSRWLVLGHDTVSVDGKTITRISLQEASA